MHTGWWSARCLGNPAVIGGCQRRATYGVFCPVHAWESLSDEAAKVATALARARLVLADPTATAFERRRAAWRVRRARRLRARLLRAIDRVEAASTDVAFAPRELGPLTHSRDYR
jgi:hypothetical protein